MGFGGLGRQNPTAEFPYSRAYFNSEWGSQARAPNSRRHFPVVRNLPLGWHQTFSGTWTFDRFNTDQFEVVCTQCGDDEGPAAQQMESLRRLRGPYPSRRLAQDAADAHSRPRERRGWRPFVGRTLRGPGTPVALVLMAAAVLSLWFLGRRPAVPDIPAASPAIVQSTDFAQFTVSLHQALVPCLLSSAQAQSETRGLFGAPPRLSGAGSPIVVQVLLGAIAQCSADNASIGEISGLSVPSGPITLTTAQGIPAEATTWVARDAAVLQDLTRMAKSQGSLAGDVTRLHADAVVADRTAQGLQATINDAARQVGNASGSSLNLVVW